MPTTFKRERAALIGARIERALAQFRQTGIGCGDLLGQHDRRSLYYRQLSIENRFGLSWVPGESECWEWVAARKDAGYGVIEKDGERWHAHRASYDLFVGAIPDGLTLDHLCRNTRCVNPQHLEPVTLAENLQRGLDARPLCKYGRHPRTPENTYPRGNGRNTCALCRQEWLQRVYARKREATKERKAQR